MTNDETRMTNQARNPNDERLISRRLCRAAGALQLWSLLFAVCRLIRYSDFVIRHFERSVPRSASDNRTSTSTASASRGVQSSSGTRSVL